MKKIRRSVITKSAAPPKKNVVRMSKASARTPPASGPRTPPAVIAPCMVPMQSPTLSRGALLAMIARHAGQRPAAKPWKHRIARSCHGS